MADNKRIVLHDLSGNNLYPVTSASLVSGLDNKIKDLIADGFSIKTGTIELGTNTAITGITLTTNATNGTAELNFTTGTIHSGGAAVKGFVKITTDANGHVTLGTSVSIDDILALGENNNKVATKQYVLDSVANGVHFRGTAEDTNSVKNSENIKLGDTWIASESFDFEHNNTDKEKVEAGDLIICVDKNDDSAEYAIIQRNIDGAVTTSVKLGSNNLVVGTNDTGEVADSGLALASVVRTDGLALEERIVISASENSVKTDSNLTVSDLKTVLDTDKSVTSGKVWTATGTGGAWADPNHISVKAGTGIAISTDNLEHTIALDTLELGSTTGAAVTLGTGDNGSLTAVTGVTVDSYGRVTGVEKTSFEVTLPSVPVLGAEGGIKLNENGKVVHDVATLTTSTNEVTLDFGTKFTADKVTRDAYGHVTGVTTTTFTLPAAPANVGASGDGVVLATRVDNEIKVAHNTCLTGLTVSEISKTVGQNASAAPGYNGTFEVPAITVDKYGHVTAASSATITLPDAQNAFTKVNGSVINSDGTVLGTGDYIAVSTNSTISLGTGLALMPGTAVDGTSEAKIVAALTYSVVNASDVSVTEIFL